MEKLKALIRRMNELGIPLPTLTDPKDGRGSVTLTMMVISFNIVAIGLIGKYAKGFDIDMSQANYLFLTTSGLYLGRKFQSDPTKKTVTIEEEKKNE
jgi:hypothetical protein